MIEISTDGGTTFADLGPNIITGSYTGQIATGCNSPISGRLAWTGGNLGTMREVVVGLSSYAGQSAILRFRLACDNGVGGSGWYIDNVRVSGFTPALTPTATPTQTPRPSPTPTNTPTLTDTPMSSLTATPTNTLTSSQTATSVPSGTLTPAPTPAPIRINVWEDGRQDPVLATTSRVADLVANDNQWTEFLWGSRGYPGVFAAYGERPPLMRFYSAVPDGTYTLVANLYWNRNLRYDWGTSGANPEQFSYDVTSGNSGNFAEYTLGTVTVSGGMFELYVRRADALPSGNNDPFWGWAWIRLVP